MNRKHKAKIAAAAAAPVVTAGVAVVAGLTLVAAAGFAFGAGMMVARKLEMRRLRKALPMGGEAMGPDSCETGRGRRMMRYHHHHGHMYGNCCPPEGSETNEKLRDEQAGATMEGHTQPGQAS